MYRYAEGAGTAALFGDIADVDFLSSTELICTDNNNQCLRLVNFTQSPPETSPFAGNCTVSGNADGHRLSSALFNYPTGTEVKSDNSILYVLDNHYTTLHIVNLSTDSVATFVTFDTRSEYFKLLDDNLLYFAQDRKVAVFNINTNETRVVAGGDDRGDAIGSFEQTMFDGVYGLLPWRSGMSLLLLVADRKNDRFVGLFYNARVQ